MAIIWVIIFGGLVGWLASVMTGRTERIGCLSNMIAGEIGALVGGLIALIAGGGVFVWGLLFAIAAVALANKFFTTQ